MSDDLITRVRRLYAAIDETRETDLSKFPATVISNEKMLLVCQDFSGGRTQEQLTNSLHALIALIAGLEYHLYKWVANNGRDKNNVQSALRTSRSYSIVHDLWNTEKHGYSPDRGNDRTGDAPQLLNVNRVMKLTTQPQTGSFVGLTLGKDGRPISIGDGTAQVVITADVVAKDGKRMCDAHVILEDAIKTCEQILRDLGIK